MKPEQVKQHVGTTPYMRLKEARIFYDLIRKHDLRNILELGFLHGVSTAYLAGAAIEIGGNVTTVDLETAQTRTPNIEEILQRCGLRESVEILYERKTFNWRLMRFLEQSPRRSFDLCYIDGGHTWVDTGFAFCLVRKMLRPGGWVVFDDILHTFRLSASKEKPWVRRMTEEEQTIAQVDRVFSLLVMRDPSFDSFRRIGNLGLAHKRTTPGLGSSAELAVEADICEAAMRARTDPAFRQDLLRLPAETLARLTPREGIHGSIKFEEGESWAPLAPLRHENGSTTIYLERPEWERRISEDDLLQLLAQ